VCYSLSVLDLAFKVMLCSGLFVYVFVCAVVVLDLVSSVLVKRLAGKNVSEMTYYVSSAM